MARKLTRSKFGGVANLNPTAAVRLDAERFALDFARKNPGAEMAVVKRNDSGWDVVYKNSTSGTKVVSIFR